MYRKKIYGMSRIDLCPFCGKQAVTKSIEDLPVCINHKKEKMPMMRCSCGEWLDLRSGKWGPYFTCLNCGNISFSKGLEMNPPIRK